MEKENLQELAEIILAEAKDKSHDKLVTDVIKVGHFNGNIFNPERMFNHSAKVFIRFLEDLAAHIGEKKFKTMMRKFTDDLWKIADDDELLDQINAEHSTKNKKRL